MPVLQLKTPPAMPKSHLIEHIKAKDPKLHEMLKNHDDLLVYIINVLKTNHFLIVP